MGCVERLYGLMQTLMSARIGGDVLWHTSPARDIVTQVDAADAIVQVAAAIDEALHEQQVNPQRMAFAGAALMVVREYVRPLPAVSSDRSDDAVGDDLRQMVKDLREAYGYPGDQQP